MGLSLCAVCNFLTRHESTFLWARNELRWIFPLINQEKGKLGFLVRAITREHALMPLCWLVGFSRTPSVSGKRKTTYQLKKSDRSWNPFGFVGSEVFSNDFVFGYFAKGKEWLLEGAKCRCSNRSGDPSPWGFSFVFPPPPRHIVKNSSQESCLLCKTASCDTLAP